MYVFERNIISFKFPVIGALSVKCGSRCKFKQERIFEITGVVYTSGTSLSADLSKLSYS